MAYRKFMLHLIVEEDDAERMRQELDMAIEKLDEQFNLYQGEFEDYETVEPENAA